MASKGTSAPGVKIIDDRDPPASKEALAQSIERIADGFTKMQAGGLNRKAIVVLLADATKLPKSTIVTVIDAIGMLKFNYCIK